MPIACSNMQPINAGNASVEHALPVAKILDRTKRVLRAGLVPTAAFYAGTFAAVLLKKLFAAPGAEHAPSLLPVIVGLLATVPFARNRFDASTVGAIRVLRATGSILFGVWAVPLCCLLGIGGAPHMLSAIAPLLGLVAVPVLLAISLVVICELLEAQLRQAR